MDSTSGTLSRRPLAVRLRGNTSTVVAAIVVAASAALIVPAATNAFAAGSCGNLLTGEFGGSFGTIANGSYRDLQQPVTGYTFGGQSGPLMSEARYAISSSYGSAGLHTSVQHWEGTGGVLRGVSWALDDAYLAVNGSTSVGTFFKQNVTLVPGQNYDLKMYANNAVTSPGWDTALTYAPNLEIRLVRVSDGVVVGSNSTGAIPYSYSGFTSSANAWVPLNLSVNSGTASQFRVEVRNLSTAAGGNDFSIDAVSVTPSVEAGCPADWGDAPDTGPGTGVGNYRTLATDNGPVSDVVAGLRIGAALDPETGLLQNATATADDTNLVPDDEDGLTSITAYVGATTATATIAVENTTGAAATLYGWIDANGDGAFGGNEVATATVAANATSATLTWSGMPAITSGTKFVRLRLLDAPAANANSAAPTAEDSRSFGPLGNGEVEDHLFTPLYPKITLVKSVASRVNASDQFKVSIVKVSDSSVLGTASTTGAGTSATTGAKDADSTAYSLTDELVAGSPSNLAQYTKSISCTNSAAGSTTVLPTGASGTGTWSVTPAGNDNITCTVTNTRMAPTIGVSKTTVGGAGSFSYTVTNSSPTSLSVTTPGADTPTLSGTAAVTNAAATVNVTETVPAGWYLSSSAVSCSDSNSAVTGTTGTFGTLITNGVTVPVSALKYGAAIVCSFSNSKAGSITIVKDAQPNNAQDFGFTTTGTGLSAFSLDDDADATLSNTKTFTGLAPGSYSVTESTTTGWALSGLSCIDPDSGTTTSVGTRVATIDLDPGEAITCTYVNAVVNPAVTLTKSASAPDDTNSDGMVSAGDTITYSFSVKNTGNVTLTNITVADPLLPTLSCTAIASLAAGDTATVTCASGTTYQLTQTNVNNGSVSNTATATATPPTGANITDTDTQTVTLTAAPAIEFTKTVSPATYAASGTTLTYSFSVKNIGNVTLTNVTVSDPSLSSLTCSAIASVAPGTSATVSCSAGNTYSTTQNDVDAGSVVNTATASGKPPTGANVSASDAATATASQNGSLVLTKTVSPTAYSAVGEVLTYSFSVKNTGNTTLTQVGVTDAELSGLTCSKVASLAPSATATISCSAGNTHTVTLADLNAGSITNTATATGTPPTGADITDDGQATANADSKPSVEVTKTVSPTTFDSVGDVLTYSFSVKNTGNVTLDPISISDPLLLTLDCASVASLDPGQSATVTCTAGTTYTVTQADLDAGKVDNTATATATPPNGPNTTGTGDATSTASVTSGVQLTKTVSPLTFDSVGDVLTYTFSVKNTGTVTLQSVTVTDALLPDLACGSVANLAPGATASVTCTGATYAVTQADLDAGSVANDATATGTLLNGPDVSNGATATSDAVASPSVVLTKSVSPTSFDSVGDVLTYSFSVKNTGNVTLTDVSVSDLALPDLVCDPVAKLAPAETATVTCSAGTTYTVDQGDLNAGSVDNTATATATPPTGPDISDDGSVSSDAVQSPLFELTKSVSPTSFDSVGDVLTYSFSVKNTGNVTLTAINVTDPALPDLICDPVGSLDPGLRATVTCSAGTTYTVDQGDLNAGSVDNTATATATPPSGPDVSDDGIVSADAVESPSLELTKSVSPTSFDTVGDTLTYTFSVKNTGNVTLHDVTVSDPLLPDLSCTKIATLAPAGQSSVTCTGNTYTVTQDDLDAGSVANNATGSGLPPTGAAVTGDGLATSTADTTSGLNLTKTVSPLAVDSVGDVLTYSFTVSNTGTVSLTNVRVSDPMLADLVCAPVSKLAPSTSATVTCTSGNTYTVAQDDLDNGSINNTATATGTPPTGPDLTDTADSTATVTASPSMELTKSVSPTTFSAVGDVLTYTFTVRNTGNVTLLDVSVSDPSLSGLVCTPVASLAPSASTEVTCAEGNTYAITQADLDAGMHGNTATADATTKAAGAVTADGSVDATAQQNPAIEVAKTVSPTTFDAVGQTLTYSFSVHNTGNVTLTDVKVSDPLLADLVCATIAKLAPDATATVTCTAGTTYATTQADLNNGKVTNTATVTATPPSGPDISGTGGATSDAVVTPSFEIIKTVTPDTFTAAGQTLTYGFSVHNTGNVTLTNVSVSDAMLPSLSCATVDTLAPAETLAVTCTAGTTYVTTQNDVDAGVVDNTATGSATTPHNGDIGGSGTASSTATPDPKMTLTKSATPATYSTVGEQIAYSFTVSNTGNVTLTDVTISDPALPDLSCTKVTSVAPGTDAQVLCTAGTTHTVTQADLDRGSLGNTATATATPPTGPDISVDGSVTTDADQALSIEVTKTVDVATFDTVGDVLTYSFSVHNTGNVTLTDVTVADPLLSGLACDTVSTLDPDQTVDVTCTAGTTYSVTQGDLDAGSVKNTATATATPPTGPNISGTGGAESLAVAGPALAVVKTVSPSTFDAVGDTLTYTFAVHNTGNVTLTDVTVTDPLLADLSCDPIASIAPDATVDATCGAGTTYAVTQADLDRGFVTNNATGTGQPPTGPAIDGTGTVTSDANVSPAVEVTKSVSPPTFDAAETVLTYSFSVHNTGNVTLSDVSVSDPLLPDLVCDPIATLAPDATASVTCASGDTYTTTQSDVDNGAVDNTASVTATPPVGPSISGLGSATSDATSSPSVEVTKSVTPLTFTTVGDVLTYTFTVANTGNVTLTGAKVSDPALGDLACADIASLAPGASADVVCTGGATHTVTQADLDAGSFTNTATVTASPPTGADVTDTGSATSDAIARPSLTVDKSVSPATFDSVGDVLTYAFTVHNTGNVTLDQVTVTDPLLANLTCAPVDSLAPDATAMLSCTSNSHVVTQGDLNAGKVDNTATAEGTPPKGAAVTAEGSTSSSAVQSPSLELTKTATPNQFVAVGDTITYTFAVRNAGNVTVTDVSVTDPMLPSLVCEPVGSLAPNQSADLVCTSGDTYDVTQGDLDAGKVDNMATATATPPTGPATTADGSTSVPATQNPGLTLAKTVSPDTFSAAKTTLTYTFSVTNTGNVTLSDVAVADPLLAGLTCDPLASIAPMATVELTCTNNTYVTTQADVDSGKIVNTASAQATAPSGPGLNVDGSATSTAAPDTGLQLTKSVTPATFDAVGDVLTYGFVVTNTGTATLSTISISDPTLADLVCDPVATLAPGSSATVTCTGGATHTVTQADLDAGLVKNTATASGSLPNGDPIEGTGSATSNASAMPSIELTKAVSPATFDSVGDTLTYTFSVHNTGNVTLHDVTVSDPSLVDLTCETLATLAPTDTATLTCTAGADHTVTQGDLDAGAVVNTATVSALPPTGSAVGGTDGSTADATQKPSVTIDKTVSPATFDSVGDTLTYTFSVTNTGNVTLSGVAVTDPLLPTLTCAVIDTLKPGVTTDVTCTGGTTYAVTQGDLDTGAVANTATVSANPPSGPAVGGTDQATSDANTTTGLQVDKSVTPATFTAANTTLTFGFSVTNTGTVTLHDVSISDPMLAGLDCATVASLAPSQTTTLVCRAGTTYTTTQADVDRGSVSNTATATATDPVGGTVNGGGGAVSTAQQAPSVSVTKSVSPTAFAAAGQTLTYGFTATNTGNVTLTDLTVADPLLGALDCTPIAKLAPGASAPFTCTGATYVTTQDDVDSGSVDNRATVTATGPSGQVTGDGTATSAADPTALIEVLKTATPATVVAAGDVVTYSFKVHNLGTATLKNITISDPMLAGLTCDPVASLAPDATVDVTCTAGTTHAVTQTEVDNGSLTNTATAIGTGPGTTPVTGTGEATTTIAAAPGLEIIKTVSLTTFNSVGDVLTFGFSAHNTGNVTLTDVNVTDPLLANLTCVPVATLAPGTTAPIDCTGGTTYAVTQADLDVGAVTNHAVGTGYGPDNTPITGGGTATSTADQAPSLALTKTVSPSTFTTAGTMLSYTFSVRNTGNVTVTNVVVSDPMLADLACTPIASLAPGTSATVSCTSGTTHETTQAEVDAGSVANTATATGTDPGENPVVDSGGSTAAADATGSMVLTKTVTPASFDSVGDVLTYNFTVHNTGQLTLTNVTVADPKLANLDCSPVASLAPDTTVAVTCTGGNTHTVTQTDLDTGGVTNTATASGSSSQGAVSDSATADADATQNTALAVTKTVTPTSFGAADTTLTYGFSVSNTGNVTLTNVMVSDQKLGSLVCDPVSTLAPGQTVGVTCASGTTYVTTDADVAAGRVDNVATATGTGPTGEIPGPGGATSTLAHEPSITIAKTVEPAQFAAVGEQLTYSFSVTNTGNVALSNVLVSDPMLADLTCTPIATLAIGASATVDCQSGTTHAVTQADLDAGWVRNTATVTATDPDGGTISGTDTADAAATQLPSIDLTKQGSPATFTKAGTTLTYTFAVTNTGNVTVTAISVVDPKLPALVCDPIASLAPGATATLTCASGTTYVTTDADVAAGSVANTAAATGINPDRSITTDTGSTSSTLSPEPSVELAKSASPSTVKQVGEVVTYAFSAHNTGNVALHNVTVTDPMLADLACDPIASLAVGESATITCTAGMTHTVTQADIDLGHIDNTATASAETGGGSTVTGEGTATVTVTVDPPVIPPPPVAIKNKLTVEKSVADDGPYGVGEIVPYTLTVTNDGDHAVDGVAVSDANADAGSIECKGSAPVTLNPGDSLVCSAGHTVTPADVASGSVQNVAAATALGESTSTETAVLSAQSNRIQVVVDQPTVTPAPQTTTTTAKAPSTAPAKLSEVEKRSIVSRLASTGAKIGGILLMGLVLTLCGLVLVRGGRRRRSNR